MKQLRPIILTERMWAEIEMEIQRLFDNLIYRPLMAILQGKDPEFQNALPTALIAAIKSGRVWYTNGRFHGSFNATLSKELKALGARYNPRAVTWTLPLNSTPVEIRFAQAAADSRLDAIRRNMLQALDSMDIESITRHSRLKDKYTKTIEWMDGDFDKTVKAITIVPKLSEAQAGRIADEWTNNLDLYIKGWAQENIVKLRGEVQANAFSGRRASGLVQMLQENYGTSKAKAKFLARQETSLLMSKFQETRYSDIGITQYKWSTSHDERVRHDHKELNGKIFSFDQPPVTNRKTGARNNPGQDFGCRCIAIPVIN